MDALSELSQRIELPTDYRCRGCPAVIASEVGRLSMQNGSCESGVKAIGGQPGEQGCKKGPVAEGHLPVMTRRI